MSDDEEEEEYTNAYKEFFSHSTRAILQSYTYTQTPFSALLGIDGYRNCLGKAYVATCADFNLLGLAERDYLSGNDGHVFDCM